ncbi:Protein of unknown function [Gryllus bimaculatus]|nr:Protein of unknown function [Gryllus bimaculatus]
MHHYDSVNVTFNLVMKLNVVQICNFSNSYYDNLHTLLIMTFDTNHFYMHHTIHHLPFVDDYPNNYFFISFSSLCLIYVALTVDSEDVVDILNSCSKKLYRDQKSLLLLEYIHYCYEMGNFLPTSMNFRPYALKEIMAK